MESESCPECAELIATLREALSRQLQAGERLQEAAARQDSRQQSAMEDVMREAREAREAAFGRFEEHLRSHGKTARAASGRLFL